MWATTRLSEVYPGRPSQRRADRPRVLRPNPRGVVRILSPFAFNSDHMPGLVALFLPVMRRRLALALSNGDLRFLTQLVALDSTPPQLHETFITATPAG